MVILIEGTLSLQQLWPDMRGMYVEPLLRMIDRGAMGVVELALVVFWTVSVPTDGLLESRGWTPSVTEVRETCRARAEDSRGVSMESDEAGRSHFAFLPSLSKDAADARWHSFQWLWAAGLGSDPGSARGHVPSVAALSPA